MALNPFCTRENIITFRLGATFANKELIWFIDEHFVTT